MADLMIMIGIPGAGKSTWCKENIKSPMQKYVSRDEIRFSLLKEEDEYFSKENEVCQIFYDTITKYLKEGYSVVADATHLNAASRKKLINNIEGYDKVFGMYIDTPLQKCLENNEKRQGTKSYVPKSAIRRMASQLSFPGADEDYFEGIFTAREEENNE